MAKIVGYVPSALIFKVGPNEFYVPGANDIFKIGANVMVYFGHVTNNWPNIVKNTT